MAFGAQSSLTTMSVLTATNDTDQERIFFDAFRCGGFVDTGVTFADFEGFFLVDFEAVTGSSPAVQLLRREGVF